MNDVRPQLEMHEQILNKYKKMLFDNNNEQNHTKNNSVNYNRAQSFDTSYKESNLNVDKNLEFNSNFSDNHRNLSQIDFLKSKYLNKIPSQNGIDSFTQRLDHNNMKTINFNDSVLNKYQNSLRVNYSKPNDNIEAFKTITNRDMNNDNVIESLKSKYLNRTNNVIPSTKDTISQRTINLNTVSLINTERRFTSDPIVSRHNYVQNTIKSENVLDKFLQKYSDENINKDFEKRLNDIKHSPNRINPEEQALKTIVNLSNNNNLFDSSSLEAIKILHNQSNIKYNISNESVVNNNNNNTNLRLSNEEELGEEVKEGNTNNLLEFSNLEKNSQNTSYNNKSYQIESINDIIASSSKIIENYEKTKNNIFENLNEIVEKTTEKIIEKDTIKEKNKDEMDFIEEEIVPISKRLENLKNLKNIIDSDLKNSIKKKLPKTEEKIGKNSHEKLERNDEKIQLTKQRVELIKIPKSKNLKKERINEETQIRPQNHSNCTEIMNSLLQDTIDHLFSGKKMKITQMERSEFDIESKDEKEINSNSEYLGINKTITPNSKGQISFISTRSKTLPKKNLCSFDSFIKENK